MSVPSSFANPAYIVISSAEEALLKRCSHFDLDITEEENAMKACEVIVRERSNQLEECKVELLHKLEKAYQQQKQIGKTDEETYFQEYTRVTRDEGVGDEEATEMALALLKEAGIEGTSSTNKKIDHRKSDKDKGKGKGQDLSNKQKDQIWELREKTHDIRKLTKELVGRVRSLRYFSVVRDLQRQDEEPPTIVCPGCDCQKVTIDDIAVLSSCGHTGCLNCVTSCAEREECVHAASAGCRAAARVLNVVEGNTLGIDDVARDGRGKHYGLKLEKVVDLIQ